MTWPTPQQTRGGLIAAAGRLLVQHWPQLDGRCRLCRTQDCAPVRQATQYLESILQPVIPGSVSAVPILMQAAVPPTGALPADLIRRRATSGAWL